MGYCYLQDTYDLHAPLISCGFCHKFCNCQSCSNQEHLASQGNKELFLNVVQLR